MPRLRQAFNLLAATVCLAVLALPPAARASMALLVEEPFGTFGAFNPTGHAAVYLSDVCADGPTHLRLCRAGELGSVISRYHRIHGYDWVVMPLIPYLYAVDTVSEIPERSTRELTALLRDRYRRTHLLQLAPSRGDGSAPGGEWVQLIGSSYDRRIYGFQVDTTTEQDMALIATLNDNRNRGHFNFFARNCADFARSLVRATFPGSIPRNSLADFWVTTPKHMARLMTKFGERTPDLHFRTFQILQVPGTIPRSHNVDGGAESLVRSKKYIVPLAYFSPPVAIGLAAAYLGRGRFGMPKDAPTMALEQAETPGIFLAEDRLDLGLPVTAQAGLACSAVEMPQAVEMAGAH